MANLALQGVLHIKLRVLTKNTKTERLSWLKGNKKKPRQFKYALSLSPVDTSLLTKWRSWTVEETRHIFRQKPIKIPPELHKNSLLTNSRYRLKPQKRSTHAKNVLASNPCPKIPRGRGEGRYRDVPYRNFRRLRHSTNKSDQAASKNQKPDRQGTDQSQNQIFKYKIYHPWPQTLQSCYAVYSP